MKKTIVCLIVILSLICFSGCSQSKNVSSSKIITACFAVKHNSGTEYSFYISKPESKGEESPPEEGGEIISIISSDFGKALREFGESFGKYDLTHLGIFFLDDGYLSESFSKDLPFIRKYIRISPTVKCFALGDTPEVISGCIDKTYDESPKEFIDSSWRGHREKILCTLSELVFSVENPVYTASLPVVSVSSNEAIKTDSFVFYNTKWGVMWAPDKDYELYSNHLKKYGKTSKAVKIYPDDEKIRVNVSSISENKKEMIDMAQKYTALGFDFMNVFYYTKKFFLDFESYFSYIKNMDHTNIRYE